MLGVPILISEKVDFKPVLVEWDKEGHFIVIKGTIHQKEIAFMNLYAPNVYVHQTHTTGLKHTHRQQHSALKDFNTLL
jgi:hypothetical protein